MRGRGRSGRLGGSMRRILLRRVGTPTTSKVPSQLISPPAAEQTGADARDGQDGAALPAREHGVPASRRRPASTVLPRAVEEVLSLVAEVSRVYTRADVELPYEEKRVWRHAHSGAVRNGVARQTEGGGRARSARKQCRSVLPRPRGRGTVAKRRGSQAACDGGGARLRARCRVRRHLLRAELACRVVGLHRECGH